MGHSISSQQMYVASLSQNLIYLVLMWDFLCSSTQAVSFPDIISSQITVFRKYAQEGNATYTILTETLQLLWNRQVDAHYFTLNCGSVRIL
jgi:hypothetical protein